MKVNTDAAFYLDDMSVSTVVVITDPQGKLIQAEARWYDSLADVLIAEALAVRDDLEVAARTSNR
uniref:RNase H type-1 domain-containing protein n=1 Tax=Arundo donax TaxID=35708 RepID=A0A0A9AEK5_ARUDO